MLKQADFVEYLISSWFSADPFYKKPFYIWNRNSLYKLCKISPVSQGFKIWPSASKTHQNSGKRSSFTEHWEELFVFCFEFLLKPAS